MQVSFFAMLSVCQFSGTVYIELAALNYMCFLEHMVDEYLLWDPSGLPEPEGVLRIAVIYEDFLLYIVFE